MAIIATVTDILTEGFAEVALQAEDGKRGKERHIAEFQKSAQPKRGDEVELKTAAPRDMKIARIAYILPVLGAVFAILLSGDRLWSERLLNGAILGVLAFVLAWLMNRRARLLRRQEYRIVRVVKRRAE